MKIAIAVFNYNDELICKQDIMELCNTHKDMVAQYPKEVGEYTKSEFIKTLDSNDFIRLIEQVH